MGDYMFLFFLIFFRIRLIIENVYFQSIFILYIKRETINHGFLVWLDYSTGGN